MKTFYINTTTSETTIAIFDKNTPIAEKRWLNKHNEAERLLTETNKLLKKTKIRQEHIKRLVVCRGPGGFTSTRIGISAANAWRFAKNILLGTTSVFDLYHHDLVWSVIVANDSEAWIKKPGENPFFVHKENFNINASFSFGGILNAPWKTFLLKKKGTFIDIKEALPSLTKIFFEKKSVMPWYYKDANITIKKP